MAGVIGRRKFTYDLWGDTVNTASRMESHGIPGQIQVTPHAYERLRHLYHFQSREPVEVKGKGLIVPYLLVGRDMNAPTAGGRRARANHCFRASTAAYRSRLMREKGSQLTAFFTSLPIFASSAAVNFVRA